MTDGRDGGDDHHSWQQEMITHIHVARKFWSLVEVKEGIRVDYPTGTGRSISQWKTMSPKAQRVGLSTMAAAKRR